MGSGGHSKVSSPLAKIERTRLTASAATALGEGGSQCFEVIHDSFLVPDSECPSKTSKLRIVDMTPFQFSKLFPMTAALKSAGLIPCEDGTAKALAVKCCER